jgi:hypothetical protein
MFDRANTADPKHLCGIIRRAGTYHERMIEGGHGGLNRGENDLSTVGAKMAVTLGSLLIAVRPSSLGAR